MFKKHITATGTHILSGKDVKALRRDILKQYHSITEEDLSQILPAKATITLTKLNNRCQVYGVEGGSPLFFDPEARGALLPTILGGADLFLQGVLAQPGGLGDWLAGSARSVTVPGNPAPFAIGRMAVSKTEAARDGMKGRGLTVLHHYPDLLWAMGDKSVPNDGFTQQRVFPLEQQAQAEAAPEPDSSLSPAGDAVVEAGAEQLQDLSLSAAGDSAADTAAPAANVESEAGDTTAPSAAGGAAAGQPASMDALLEAAVLAGLRQTTNAELPMQTGDFYTKKMLAFKPEGVVFDFKQSSYKKLGKLLDKFEKEKVLTQKVIRKQDNISAISRSHALLQEPAAAGPAAAAQGSARPASGSSSKAGGSTQPGGANSNGSSSALKITYCYRAPTSLRPVFGDAGRDKDRLYSGAEVEEALQQYAQAAGLLSADGSSIQLDQLLVHAGLYTKKEPQQAGDRVPVKDVLARLIDKLQLHHRLVRPGDQGGEVEVVRKGQVRPVSIADEKRSGRDVTKVAHLESFALAPVDMAAVFQRKFQCSATVNKLPGNQEKDMEIMLQGRLAKQVAEFLSSSYGIPPAFMEIKAGKK
ncbi:hypothetical protein N2152v2_007057 [Parachlorella kessleri]